MRNKILVLVLALICLFAVSAMAAGSSISMNEQQMALYVSAIEDMKENHKDLAFFNDGTDPDGSKAAWWHANGYSTWSVGAAGNLYIVKEADLKSGNKICSETSSITLFCTCSECAKGAENSPSGVPMGKAVKVSFKATHTIGASNKDLLERKANSCLTNGYEIWKCTLCGDQFKINETNYQDYLAQADFLDDTIPKQGHKAGTPVRVEATCEKKAADVTKCTVCQVVLSEVVDETSKLAEHKYADRIEYYETVDTCLQAGKKIGVRACTVCGKSDTSASTGSYEKVLPQIKHDDAKNFPAYNLATLFSDKGELKYYSVVTPAKVDANGVPYVKILNPIAKDTIEASYEFEGVKGDKLVTRAGVYTYEYVAPECGVDGSVTITCENCDTTLKYAVKAEEHYFTMDNHHLIWEDLDDCTKSPVAVFKCIKCGFVKKEAVAADVAHEYSKKVTGYIQYQDDGRTKLYFEKNEDGVLELLKLDDIWVWDLQEDTSAYKFAECAPYYEVYQCVNCTPAMNLWWWNNDTKEWDNEREWRSWCQDAKLVEETKVVKTHSTPAADKFYKKTDATCAKPGLWIYECTVCGNVIEETPKATGKHNVTTWTPVDEAKCGVAGLATGKCTICKLPQEKVLPALEHEYKEDVKQSVAVSNCVDGKKVEVCIYCDDVKTTIIPAMHGYSKNAHLTYKEYKASNCKEVGYAIFDCVTCNREVKVDLEKVEHTMAIVLNEAGKIAYHDATCCTGKYYETKCEICGAVDAVYVGEALGHAAELTKAEMDKILADLADNRKADDPTVVVMGALSCTEGANAKKICNNVYYEYKDGKKSDAKHCTHEYNFVVPALGHEFETVKNPVTGEMESICWVCETKEEIVAEKPEYEVKLDGTKGTVKLINKTAAGLKQAWVRISYGFELSDGSYLAMTTCMPITFNEAGTAGTFSFFALNTSLESTGVNIMVVDQYDDMYKSIGELVGDNYGLYIG